MARKYALHDGALHALPTPVDEADLHEALLVRRLEVVVHDAGDVAGCERVQVERGLDRQLDGSVFGHGTLQRPASTPARPNAAID